jgi:hypothetical protein
MTSIKQSSCNKNGVILLFIYKDLTIPFWENCTFRHDLNKNNQFFIALRRRNISAFEKENKIRKNI